MQLYHAALRALDACEARDAAYAHRETLWRPSGQSERSQEEQKAAYLVWLTAQDAYVLAFNEANRLLDEYRRVRLAERIAANNQCEKEQQARVVG
ncbi:MAG: hypothetical protein NTW96_27605 [Planctomycetia bacterium]|nr:hypothetical protein [Planctomycetia bacterium]